MRKFAQSLVEVEVEHPLATRYSGEGSLGSCPNGHVETGHVRSYPSGERGDTRFGAQV